MIDFPTPIPLNEVRTYLRLAKDGNLQAQRALIMRNGRMVTSLAKTFSKKAPYLTMDDLIQEGLAIIPTAIKRYDLDSKAAFPTYLSFWIFHAFSKMAWKNKFIVEVPLNVVNASRNKKRGIILKTANAKDVEYYDNLEMYSDETVMPDGKVASFWDIIPDTNVDIPDVHYKDYKLTDLETEILNLIYNENYTYQAIGELHNCTKECVRQRARDALIAVKEKILNVTPKRYLGTILSTPKLRAIRGHQARIRFEEYYVETEKGFERKCLKPFAIPKTQVVCWKDIQGNSYDIAYLIPRSHFTRNRLEMEFQLLIKYLKEAHLEYEYVKGETSDKNTLRFDSYLIRYGIQNEVPGIKISSFYRDINSFYAFKDINALNLVIKEIISKLQ